MLMWNDRRVLSGPSNGEKEMELASKLSSTGVWRTLTRVTLTTTPTSADWQIPLVYSSLLWTVRERECSLLPLLQPLSETARCPSILTWTRTAGTARLASGSAGWLAAAPLTGTMAAQRPRSTACSPHPGTEHLRVHRPKKHLRLYKIKTLY